MHAQVPSLSISPVNCTLTNWLCSCNPHPRQLGKKLQEESGKNGAVAIIFMKSGDHIQPGECYTLTLSMIILLFLLLC
jgi:hypothetical protein